MVGQLVREGFSVGENGWLFDPLCFPTVPLSWSPSSIGASLSSSLLAFFLSFAMVKFTKADTNGEVPISPSSSIPHPLDQLSSHEIDLTRQVILDARGKCHILFRSIYTEEPAKADLLPFLVAEHAGTLDSDTQRPPRLARVQYDTISDNIHHEYMESVVDVDDGREVKHRVVDKKFQCSLVQ